MIPDAIVYFIIGVLAAAFGAACDDGYSSREWYTVKLLTCLVAWPAWFVWLVVQVLRLGRM
jgi:hypothetical protein